MTNDLIAKQPDGAVKDLLVVQQARIAELEFTIGTIDVSRQNYTRLAQEFQALAIKQRGEIDVLQQRLDAARETCALLQEECSISHSRMQAEEDMAVATAYIAALERQCDLRYSAGRKLAFHARSFWQLYHDQLGACEALRRREAVLVNELTRRGMAWRACAVAAGLDREVGA